MPETPTRMINNVPLHTGLHEYGGMCTYLECEGNDRFYTLYLWRPR